MYSDNKSFEDHQMRNERLLNVQSLLTRQWHHRLIVRQNKKRKMKNEPCDILLSPRKKYLQREQFFLNNSHKLRHLNIKYMFLACIEPIIVTL